LSCAKHSLSTRETCRVLRLPRAKQYRVAVARVEAQVAKELQRQNYNVNHKKILSMMRKEALLCTRGKPRKAKDPHSNPINSIFFMYSPNLVGKL
jgi:hypothetical protein